MDRIPKSRSPCWRSREPRDCMADPARAQEKIPVVATLPVLADLVEAVGGTGSR